MNLRRNAVAVLAVTTAVAGAISAAIILPPPMTTPIVNESALDSTAEPADQQPPTTEKPPVPVLIKVAISPEARVKATATAGQRDLQQGEWSEFTIKIDNAAGITAPLVVESEQLMTTEHDTARDHWLRLTIEPTGPLSGEPTENRTLRLQSRDPGIRTAVLNINAGQGTQDLGFRSDVTVSFHISPTRTSTKTEGLPR